ncbi:hypothetical protein ZOSMA_29G01580 [Zostera marina]|uniref:Uncharacterized protein n=1 Tax=Zostera marina TaxID=29655 RepID=A0A0K9PE41_ZOSMR|nr:hypothetical protein ZOSMA_29G01580 [Zostera marina]
MACNLRQMLIGRVVGRNPAKINIRVFHNHSSTTYAKNIDHKLRPGTMTLPYDASNEYWLPHPTTGCFGPAGAEFEGSSSSSGGSILDREVCWFRSIDTLDKPT